MLLCSAQYSEIVLETEGVLCKDMLVKNGSDCVNYYILKPKHD